LWWCSTIVILAAHRAQADASWAVARSAAASADAGRDAADAGLVLAKAHYARIQQLRDRNSAIPAELDRATADLRIAEGTARSAAARSAEAAAVGDGGRGRRSRCRGGRVVFNHRRAL
jgi:multidrug resistance efflux pump